MFNNKEKKMTRGAAMSTLIGAGTTIRGDVNFSGGLHLDGRIEGIVRAEPGTQAVLTVSDQGCIVGEIHVPQAVINGAIKGDIHASEHLQLAGQARIEGNVSYKVLEMAAGSQITGKIMHQAEPQRQLTGPEIDAVPAT
jgi:cytoskeletal protein CcmA (bactofilin family)